MAKIRLTTGRLACTHDVLVLEMTPATILRVGKCANAIMNAASVPAEKAFEAQEDWCPTFLLGEIPTLDQQEIAKLVLDIYEALYSIE